MFCFGPYLEQVTYSVEMPNFPFLQFAIVFLGVFSVSSISFWGAYNLGALKFMSLKSLRSYLLISIWLNVLSFFLSVVTIPVELQLYGLTTGNFIAAVGYSFSVLWWSLTSILLSIFARKQLAGKAAGRKLESSDVSEIFE